MKLRKSSLFSAVAGTLMLVAAFAPRAEAVTGGLQYYFDFNTEANNTSADVTPLTSRAVGSFGGTYPLKQTSLTNGQAGLNLFSGNGAGAGLTVKTSTGTLVNAFDADIAGGALRLRSNNSSGLDNCFTIGPMNFTGLENISISFALKGGGVKGFQSLQLAYSTNNVNFTNFGGTISMAGLTTYTLESKNLPTVTNGASTLYISFCFSGASDSGVSTASFIDNIQITAKVPEPTTAVSGVLAVLAVFGLCWSQRRCLIESLRFRRA